MLKLLYNASDTIEAHMVLNLLTQAGLDARVEGEYLQGAIGELPAFGVVRVMVAESNYTEAKAIMDEWNHQSCD